MQVNVKKCPGGGNWYENYIHRLFHNQGSSKIHSILLNCL